MILEETARAQPAPAGEHVRVEAARKQWIYRDALKPLAELDGSGALVSEFVYGSKGNVPDYVRRGGATYRVISDHLGSPRYVVNVVNAGEVPFSASYTSFGEVTGTGLGWMPFGFAGGIYDGDSGLVRFGARDMDPTIGRWASKEPLRFEGERNFFVYALNDPINYVDPTGLAPTDNDSARAIACAVCRYIQFVLAKGCGGNPGCFVGLAPCGAACAAICGGMDTGFFFTGGLGGTASGGPASPPVPTIVRHLILFQILTGARRCPMHVDDRSSSGEGRSRGRGDRSAQAIHGGVQA